MGLPFYLVDVFAEAKYAGNQLAVVAEAGHLKKEEMQDIAREINFSETAFILGTGQGREAWPVRIFTPGEEIPFAGHPSLGTAFVIQQEYLRTPVEAVKLDLPGGRFTVSFTYREGEPDLPDLAWVRQGPPLFGPVYPHAEMAASLGLSAEDLLPDRPVQEVSTGLPFILAPLKSLAALDRCSPDRYRLDGPGKDVQVFCPEARTPGSQYSARVFCPTLFIAEDPATGSAAGCLAAYLLRYGLPGEEGRRHERLELHLEQGFHVGRPSLLLLRAEIEEGGVAVSVGGRVIRVGRGELY